MEIQSLEPYFKIAEIEAKKSPCARKQYGGVIVYPGFNFNYVTGYNQRLGQCCNSHCVRDRLNISHNGSVEIGAELHCEAVCLLNWGNLENKPKSQPFFILTSFESRTGKRLFGEHSYPCHSCAFLLKYAGFNYVWIRGTKEGDITPISVSEIIDYRESAWEYA